MGEASQKRGGGQVTGGAYFRAFTPWEMEDFISHEIKHHITATKRVIQAITHWRETWRVNRHDPLVILRAKTCTKTAIAVLLSFLFVVVPSLRLVIKQRLYAVMQSVIVTLIVHQNLVGVMQNSFDVLHGGLVGCISGYVVSLISTNLYVSLVIFFFVTFCIGAYDHGLTRPLFMRISVWDYLVIVFFPVEDQSFKDILYMYVMHITTVICVLVPFTLLWPNLSSRQFM